MQDQRAKIEWREADVPVSIHFDDPYYSLENGVGETQHVFLAGNGLPQRFRDGFHIAELGFGTGLNLLVALYAWRQSGQKGQLQFTSFEAFPMDANEMVRAQHQFADLKGISSELEPFWGLSDFETSELNFKLVIGDARETLPQWDGMADAWFLDGFSPAKNPELWQPDLLQNVAAHTITGGTAATYTAAGAVRRDLQVAGFEVSRIAGFGRKRHMTRAVKVAT
ncbi:MAG: tRNA (5-methylaminomethyl-2-thiouridine)(34)-methyltransferase MnmD [Pseudomonadota bacterium]